MTACCGKHCQENPVVRPLVLVEVEEDHDAHAHMRLADDGNPHHEQDGD